MIFDLRSASLETLDPEEIVRGVADELRANTLAGSRLPRRRHLAGNPEPRPGRGAAPVGPRGLQQCSARRARL